MKLIWTILVSFSVLANAFGSNVYVRVGASGSNDGTDWTNALTSIPSVYVRGNTYYVASGTYSGSPTFSTATAGTSLITIKKAIVSDHGTGTGWLDAYAVGPANIGPITFSTSYWVIDGQTGGGSSAWSSGFGFAVFSDDSVLCLLNGPLSNVTILHTSLDSDRGSTFIAGIKGTTFGASYSSLTVKYCAIRNVFGPMFWMNNWSNCDIEYCYVASNKSTAEDHSEGVSSIGSNVSILWNSVWWDQIEGTAVFAGVGPGNSDQWTIQNNLFTGSTTSLYYYYEADPSTNKNTLTNSSIYNNTISGSIDVNQSIGGFATQQGSGNIAKNNLFYGVASNAFPWNNITHDYSWAFGNYRNGVGEKDSEIVSGEANGVIGTSIPFVGSLNFHLNATTTAISSGVNLSSFFTTDADGVTRLVPWGMGALAYVQAQTAGQPGTECLLMGP